MFLYFLLWHIVGNQYTFRGCALSILVLVWSELYVKRKACALPWGSKFFPYRVDLFSEGAWCVWKQRGLLQHCLPCDKFITKTCLYKVDPLKPHFYIVKLLVLFLLKNIDCGYSLEPPLTSTHSLCFEQIYEKKKIGIFIWKFSFFLVVNFSVYLNRLVFVMYIPADTQLTMQRRWYDVV